MNEWKELELVDCTVNGKISYGIVQPGQDDPNGIPILRVNNFENGGLNTDSVLKVNQNIEAKHLKTRLKGGEVLLTLVGSTGQTAIVPEILKGWNVARAVAVISVKPEIGAKWINLWLRSSIASHHLNSRANTTVQKTLNLEDVKSTPILLPPDFERKAIEHFIFSIEDKIELNRKMNQTLEAMAQGLFKSWFVDFDPVIDNSIQAGNEIPAELQARAEKRRVIANREERSGKQSQTPLKPLLQTNPNLAAQFPAAFVFNETLGKWIPEGWEVRTIKEFGKVVCGKTPSKSNPEFYGGTIPFVKIPNMHNEVFVLSTDEYLTEKGSESQANKLIPPGSISVSCIATVGKVIITNQPCHTNQQINSILPHAFIYRYFLYFTMLNLEKHFHDLASAGSTTLNMNTSTFSNISILFPPKGVLSEFHQLVFPKFSKILLNQMEKETLTNLRDRLLPELISGRVRVKEGIILKS